MIGIQPRSIRFRLTALYALMLAIAVVALAVLIATLLERRLNSNFDEELVTTASAIRTTAQPQQGLDGQLAGFYLPALDPFSTAGYFIELYDLAGQSRPRVTFRSENLGTRDLPYFLPSNGQRSSSFHNISVDEEKVRLYNVPLTITGYDETVAVLVVGASTEQIDSTIDEVRKVAAIGAGVAILFTSVGGWFLAGRALRPVERMRAEAAAITAERSSLRPILAERIKDPHTNDEISRLAQTFNELLDRIEATFDVERRFIADASHELRSPLTAIRGNVDVLLRQADRSTDTTVEEREALTDMQREANRMSRLLEDLLTLARADTASSQDLTLLSPISLYEPVSSAARTAQALAPDREIVTDLRDDPRVNANPDQIEQVALILLDNAIRHSAAPTPVTIRLQRSSAYAEIVVIDRGEGIAPEHLAHLFDRFYRVDTARSRNSGGTGLGLAIAHSIVLRHGGEIDVLSALGIGTTFVVKLPLGASPPNVASHPAG
jgi:heavy metal sensor kinase